MEDSVRGQPFDGQNFLSFDLFHGNLAGPDRFLIDEDRAGPAERFSAAVLGPREGQVSAKDPEKLTLPIHCESHGFSVQLEVDCFDHLLPLSVGSRPLIPPLLFKQGRGQKFAKEVMLLFWQFFSLAGESHTILA